MNRISLFAALLGLTLSQASCQTPAAEKLAPNLDYRGPTNAVVLIIRHAEKPESGFDLTPAGHIRAAAYVGYFKEFQIDSQPLKLDYLFAATDSDNSHRPRLTIEPLSHATGIKIDTRFTDKAPIGLAEELHARDHGRQILVSWRHSGIPKLIAALGVDPLKLLPAPRWPEDVFDWVIVLRFDQDGKVIPSECKRINEKLMFGDSKN